VVYTYSISEDYELIKQVALAQNNLRKCFDDFWSDPQSYEPFVGDNIFYIKCMENELLLGFFCLIRKDRDTCEAHMSFLPVAYGKVAEVGRQCLKWIRANLTDINYLISPCVESNRLADQCIRAMGFELFGYQNKAWLQHGKWESMLWFKIGLNP
jgi:hypothetical protein